MSPRARRRAPHVVLAAALAVCALASGCARRLHAEPAVSGVGFEKSPLRLKHPDGAERASTLFLWYPADRPSERHDYDGQIGFATPGAPVAQGKHPLLLFSHGYLGAGDQSIFLTESLARAGYVVAALDHVDASRGGGSREIPPFLNPESWDEQRHRDRAEDLRFLIDALLARAARKGDRLHGHIDAQAIGGIGHSLGGYTLLGMAGAWPPWRDERLRAFALLSPYASPYVLRKRLDVRAPVMLQGGTFDFGITPELPGLYALLRSPKYFLVLRGENHFGWTNFACLGRTTHACSSTGNPEQMVDYAIAFFDRHLRGQRAPLLDAPNRALASYRSDP